MDTGVAAKKKSYKRTITEKRRQQNRDSQRKYRQHIRKQLEKLKEQTAEKRGDIYRDSSSREAAVPNVFFVDDDENDVEEGTEVISNFIDLNAALGTEGDRPFLAGSNLGFTNFQYPPRPREEPHKRVIYPTPHPSCTASPTYSLASDFLIPVDKGSPDLRQLWHTFPSALITDYSPPPHLFTPEPSYASLASSPASLTVGSCWTAPTSSSTSGLPNPYLNFIFLSGERCMHASFSIATVLGITQSAYINDHPSHFYHSIDPNFHYLPRYLRPTPNQLTLPHPCYLDCIIFPAFRSRAIALSAKGELDHCALFMDLLYDGLVCWGNAYANIRACTDMRDGVAWSARSWEARPWFLRRWAFLVGKDGDVVDKEEDRDDDGVWEQSRWF